ncbi:hypothetical protein QAD02_002076 [Eretmocerus hayati]|uniref:Uncharacterized protein n=1 Tax=Eretmocerus hayati TaxID=131215 RepID=A0ACC2NI84_9HYME|nr:hypothetical protein QAD02_002076 [Eretmocerus hayati]
MMEVDIPGQAKEQAMIPETPSKNLKRPPPSTISSVDSSPVETDQNEIILETEGNKSNTQEDGDGFVFPKKTIKRRTKRPKVEKITEEEIKLKVTAMLEPVKEILEKLPLEEYISFKSFKNFMVKSWGRSDVVEMANSIPDVNIDKLTKTLEFTHTLMTGPSDKARLTRLKNKIDNPGVQTDSEDTDSSQGHGSKDAPQISA